MDNGIHKETIFITKTKIAPEWYIPMIRFKHQKLMECCGVQTLFDFGIPGTNYTWIKETEEEQFTILKDFILKKKGTHNLARSSLMIIAIENTILNRFCKYMNCKPINRWKNKNTDNWLIMYVYNRGEHRKKRKTTGTI